MKFLKNIYILISQTIPILEVISVSPHELN